MAFISIYSGGLASGKSHAAREDAKSSPSLVLWIVPTSHNKNPDITAIPFMMGIPERLKFIQKELSTRKEMRLVYDRASGGVLLFDELLKLQNVTFIFDDFPALLPSKEEQDSFEAFLSTIRHQNSRVILTTQRVKGEVSPFVRSIMERLHQVSALNNTDEAMTLYRWTNTNTYGTFKEFNEAIKINPKYGLFPVVL